MPKYEETIFGTPCWIDLTTADIESVRPFYTAIFGWSFQDMGPEFGNYNIISVGEDVVGGAMQYSAEFMGPEPINAWSLYFATADITESIRKVEELGGNITFPPMQVGDQGTNAEATDPGGVQFGLWQPDQRRGFDRWGEHGFPGWFELQTRRYDDVGPFYSKLLEADLVTETIGEGMRYGNLNVYDQSYAGIWDINGVMSENDPESWNIYLIVDDTDIATAAARENGGTVVSEPRDSDHGRMATLKDPTGSLFNIISAGEM